MKTTHYRLRSAIAATALATGAIFISGPVLAPMLMAQAPAGASIHGSIKNAAGMAVNNGEVRLSTDRSSPEKDRKYQFTFPVDATGTYKGDNIAPGDYVLFYIVNGKTVDFIDHVILKAGDAKVLDDDMTREEFMKNMTPEEKKNIEEFKKKNAEAVAANSKVANLNTSLSTARADMKAGNWDNAVTTMTQATTQKPDEGLLWFELGNAELGQADANVKKAGKPVAADPTLGKGFDDAIVAYQKAIDLNAASKKPSVETTAAAYNQMGQAYAKGGKGKEASGAYEKAAQAEPAKAGMYYFNEAATLYNAGNRDDAAVAADKAIAADPNKADAYYIKGQSLIGKSTVDPKSQKIIPPPGCGEAYAKFLELAPAGPRAEEVKGIMSAFDDKVVNGYKAGKKK